MSLTKAAAYQLLPEANFCTEPGIIIQASTIYVPEESNAKFNHHVFRYTITIHNYGDKAARILSRRWVITDAQGNVNEIHGIGVVGKQPFIQPGKSFEYTSGAVLATPIGCMQGSYRIAYEDGVQFDAIIAPFSLANPAILH